ncbi:MAG: dTDP-4-dehydrorhamnose reductase [Gemmatimonas sp.]|nr:dTDP-4-dehydrorhamnose reductase [Gemmatimonas sp.]
MRILISGASGQLGREFCRTAPPSVTLLAPSREQLDVTRPDVVLRAVDGFRPDWIINAAGYTAVDRAESEPAEAFAVNRDGAANLAVGANETGARLLHVSTDFVFAGEAGRPYGPEDEAAPISVYGRSKLEGELAVRSALPEAIILRTAWLYSIHGTNFVKSMLQLLTERDRVTVVDDQIGTPTWTQDLANAIWSMVEARLTGVHHWTNAGLASWYDFAAAIRKEAISLEMIAHPAELVPIRTEEFPAAAARPAFSVLDKSHTWRALGYTPPHWQESLGAMLRDLVRTRPDSLRILA